jgi:hypothetical protein
LRSDNFAKAPFMEPDSVSFQRIRKNCETAEAMTE